MKWYLSLVLIVFLGTVGYRLFVMVRWTPSIETLSRTIAVRAPVLWGRGRQGAVASDSIETFGSMGD